MYSKTKQREKLFLEQKRDVTLRKLTYYISNDPGLSLKKYEWINSPFDNSALIRWNKRSVCLKFSRIDGYDSLQTTDELPKSATDVRWHANSQI